MDKHARDYLVCPCRQVTRGQVEDWIGDYLASAKADTPPLTLKAVCQGVPVGNQCGGCREDIDQILTEMLAK